jgi:hypothetical protein
MAEEQSYTVIVLADFLGTKCRLKKIKSGHTANQKQPPFQQKLIFRKGQGADH